MIVNAVILPEGTGAFKGCNADCNVAGTNAICYPANIAFLLRRVITFAAVVGGVVGPTAER